MKIIKLISTFIALTLIVGCNNSTEIENKKSINSGDRYKFYQGLGSIMLDIQARHSKLYYAGNNENWELASFFVSELKESFNDITTHHRSHDEVNLNKLTNQIMTPALDELQTTIKEEDLELFLKGFDKLTSSCNSCHNQSNHPFIKIKRPINGDFLNQDFK